MALRTLNHFVREHKKPNVADHSQDRDRHTEHFRIDPLVYDVAVKLGVKIADRRGGRAEMKVGGVYRDQKSNHRNSLNCLINAAMFDV